MAQIVNGIDYCMKYFEEYKIKFDDNQLYLGLLEADNKIIRVRKSALEEDQVKYILHEIIHLHPVFLGYLDTLCHGLLYTVMYGDKAIESQIEKLAQETYNSRPDIVERIKESIEKAKSIPINGK